ncbi:flagellin [candidate division KSB1 bacterium]
MKRIMEDKPMGDIARVHTNLFALRTMFQLNQVGDNIMRASERIASGLRVNRASDDPAAYYASTMLSSEISTLKVRERLVESGSDWLQTQDNYLAQAVSVISEMLDLAKQADTSTATSAEKIIISYELSQLAQEVDQLLSGEVASKIKNSVTSPLSIDRVSDIKIVSGVYSASALTISYSDGDLIITGTGTQLTTAIDNLSGALDLVTRMEGRLGAFLSRMEFRLSDIESTQISKSSELSVIRDADLAAEQVELTRNQILQQAGLAILAQAGFYPQLILNYLMP